MDALISKKIVWLHNEQDAMDNIPENLQATERYERMEDVVDSLNDALEKIEDAKGHIQSVLG